MSDVFTFDAHFAADALPWGRGSGGRKSACLPQKVLLQELWETLPELDECNSPVKLFQRSLNAPVLLGRCATQLLKRDRPVKFRPPPGLPAPDQEVTGPKVLPFGEVTPADPGPPPGLFPDLSADCRIASTTRVRAPAGGAAVEVLHHSSGSCSLLWRIDTLCSKLRSGRGSPLLSPVFEMAGLSDLRLLFAPGEEWLELAAGASSRRQRYRREKAGGAQDSQSFGALKLKAGDMGLRQGIALQLQVFLGSRSATSVEECDFSTEVVRSYSLSEDWRKHMESGSLVFRLECSWTASPDV